MSYVRTQVCRSGVALLTSTSRKNEGRRKHERRNSQTQQEGSHARCRAHADEREWSIAAPAARDEQMLQTTGVKRSDATAVVPYCSSQAPTETHDGRNPRQKPEARRYKIKKQRTSQSDVRLSGRWEASCLFFDVPHAVRSAANTSGTCV